MIRFYIIIVCILFSGALFSQKWQIKGNVSFISDAPLEMISAESKKLNGLIDVEKSTFAFTIPLKSFEGFNSALQKEHFHENYMESGTFPNITYAGKLLDKFPSGVDGVYEVRSKGFFTIHGVKKERILKNTIRVKGNKIFLESQFTILLDEYNIVIPKIVHKKIAEEIKVFVTGEAFIP